jgi:C4-dicarboxylate transporter DctM subunit
MAEAILFGGFAAFLILNVPIGISIGLAVMCYIALGEGVLPMKFLAQNMFTSCDSFPLMAIPFFILAGSLMEGGGLSKRLVALANSLVGHVAGGLAIVTVLTCMFFGAISGSSPATVAAIGSIMIPAMVKEGYPQSFSTGLAAAAGGLGVIIPPSIPMVVYGIATGASIGTMFMGGFGPGIVLGGCLMLVSYYISKKNGYRGSGKPFDLKEVIRYGNEAKWALFVPIIILGGIYGGIFTPTEAAVVAVFYGFLVGMFIYRELTWERISQCLVDTSLMVGTVLIIVGTGTTLGKVLTIEQLPDTIAAGLNAITDNKYVLLVLLNLFLLVVGCVMETLAAILILGPILYPVVQQYGIDIIHFGLLMVVNLAIGFITPPVGVNLFVACGLTGMSLDRLSKAMLPFLFAMLAAMAAITYLPQITLALPKFLGMIK